MVRVQEMMQVRLPRVFKAAAGVLVALALACAAGCSTRVLQPSEVHGWFSSQVDATRSIAVPSSADASTALTVVLPGARRDRGLLLWRRGASYPNDPPDAGIEASGVAVTLVSLDTPAAQESTGGLTLVNAGQYAVLLRARDGTLAAFTLQNRGTQWRWSPVSPIGPPPQWAGRVIDADNAGQTIDLVPTSGPLLWAVVRGRTSSWLELAYITPEVRASVDGNILEVGVRYPLRFLVAPIAFGPYWGR